MILDRVEIKNFRSIKNVTILFGNKGLILIGKNEAGKTNILKAIAALFCEYKVTNKDKRKRIQNEKIDSYYIRGVFKLSKQEKQKIKEDLENNYKNSQIFEFENGRTIDEYIDVNFSELLICIKIDEDETPYFAYWSLDGKKDFIQKDKIYLLQDEITLVKEPSQKEFVLKTYCFEKSKEIYNANPYICHYWKYSTKYLIPHDIAISSFTKDPNICVPLYNIFKLCNRNDVEQEFADALSEDGDYANLLEQVSTETTKVFRKIWKDFKDTKIELLSSGTEVLTKISEKAKYSFEDRSDGFKKFISILLMLSTKARSNGLSDHDIILIDEPDQSLYPTSAKYLKDELLKISENSYVVYTNHSQYMLDTSNIQRHLIVKKENDITEVKEPTEVSQYSEDELLLRSIGTSIFECLKENNLVFEGWLDKEIFERYCEIKKIKKQFENIGKVFLGGISGVETLVQLLILANKKFLVIADSDTTSISKKKSFVEHYPEYESSWIEYKESNDSIETLEDFFTEDYIKQSLKTNLSEDYIFDNSKSAIENITKSANNERTKIQNFKKLLARGFAVKDIKDSYQKFIEILEERL